MLNRITNLPYRSQKTTINQRSGLEMPPTAQQYVIDLMEKAEDAFLGANHPQKVSNIKKGLVLLQNTSVPTFDLVSIQATETSGVRIDGWHTVLYQRNIEEKTKQCSTKAISPFFAPVNILWFCTKSFIHDYVTIPTENGLVLTPAMVVAKSLIKTISLLGHKCY
jgi:hypothetical protein